jgi:hypothetical protein
LCTPNVYTSAIFLKVKESTMSTKYIGIQKCAKIIAETCANVQPGEKVLVIGDFEQVRSIPESIIAATHALDAEVLNVNIFPPPGGPFTKLPESLWDMMKQSDVIFVCTYRRYPIYTTPLLKEILDSGSRYLQMYMLTEDIMMRTVPINYDLMKKRVSSLSELLYKAQEVEMISPSGTNLTWSCPEKRRPYVEWDGLCRKRGEADAIPGGMCGKVIEEGTASGTLILDGTFHFRLLSYDSPPLADDTIKRMGRIWEPIRLKIEKGRVTRIEGGWMAAVLKKKLEKEDENATNFAVFGLGLNPGCIVTGYLFEDERRLGSIYTGLGGNVYAGGKTESSLTTGFSTPGCTLKLDGKVVLEKNVLKLP